ncbi:redoxin domain-containing protein [Lacipirellula sp.]|uniref:redoxin domain-containing protein n=1 Tax=Lacipirellula sp. TaxID=2691419 RepID=UPI003D0F17EE
MPAVLAPLRIAYYSLAIAICCAAIGSAGEFNPTLNIGDAAPAWEKLPGVDGKEHSLADLDAKLPVVVVFICNSCDVAADYEDRIIAFAEKHQDETAVVAICASAKPADALPRLRERAEARKFPFIYLHDKSQQIGQAYGANYTPEFFLLSAGKPEVRRIVYMGAMDDSTYADQVKSNYLEPALAALLAGDEPTTKETAPRGCRIKYPRKRE